MDKKTIKLPIGVSDFDDMILGNYYYVDKSLFIKEILDKGDKILLVPRPRRFGKTLNLSMLKSFFDCCPGKIGVEQVTANNSNKRLFDSLAICNSGKEYMEQMAQFPVIFLTFKDVKNRDWMSCFDKMKQLIQAEYSRHYYLLKWDGLLNHEKDYLKRVVELTGSTVDYENSLGNLLIFLNRYYNKRAIILIDEYDEPVHAGYNYGYYDEIINFMRNFLCAGLKDTGQYLEKSVITGIMRIAKESIFSGLNNPGVYTLLANEFSNYFGFTEEEVKNLLKEFDILDKYDGVQEWYNGYRFGDKVIYNPWSIINYLGSDDHELKPYWTNTSDNAVVEDLLSDSGKELKHELEQLVRGESIEKAIEENIILKDIKLDEDVLWSFLLMGGYLKQTAKRMDEHFGRIYCTLSIPNKEVISIYIRIINRYFVKKVENKKLQLMLKALVEGDVPLFEKMLQNIVQAIFSYHDFSGEPEKVYHALVMGLLVWLIDTHEIKSNRESGYGRYDIMVIPNDPSGTGYVIEFKKVGSYRDETPEVALTAALQQIEDKKYAAELEAKGIQHIKKLAIAFKGKEIYLKCRE